MNKFTKQRNAYNKAMEEIRNELIEEIRLVLYRMSKYKKYEGKKIGFSSGIGVFSLYVEDNHDCNNFNIIGRLCNVVDEFGAFMDSRRSGIVFFRCAAIPDGHMWVVGKQGGADRWEGSLG